MMSQISKLVASRVLKPQMERHPISVFLVKYSLWVFRLFILYVGFFTSFQYLHASTLILELGAPICSLVFALDTRLLLDL